jgi:hypothetical protein
MKAYKVDIRAVEVEEIEIDRATKDSVFINGTEIPREQVGYVYLQTRDGAKGFLLSYYEEMRKGLELRLTFAKQKVDQANAL